MQQYGKIELISMKIWDYLLRVGLVFTVSVIIVGLINAISPMTRTIQIMVFISVGFILNLMLAKINMGESVGKIYFKWISNIINKNDINKRSNKDN